MKLRLFEIASGGVRSAVNRLQSYQTRGYGQTGDDAGSERDDEVPFIGQPIGFVSRPVIRRGLRALGLVGDDDSVSLLAMIDRAVSHATDVGEGEARVYSPQETAVCVSVGPVHIELRVKTGGEVRLGVGGTGYAGKSVARVDDAVSAGTLYFVPGAGGAALTYSPPGGPVGTGTPIPLSGLVVAAGAPAVKA